ncbi:Predicted oxidoreductase, contains short-chain dehydrogenase (SDR) and DUF2520 domains [Prevotellaceae bacterium HUN156]|nr:Predicted oxidoreductase, contains short-chain dehydrogenase (SDR) and DUF2520 domains [Prevotellaceae bacterium HUN156]
MNVAMIGRGRVATHMSKALLKAGNGVVSVNSRTLEELPQDADVYIIAVKDSALQDVIRQLTNLLKTKNDAPLIVHTAGSMPLSVFEGYAENGGVFYPMQTFSMKREVDFREIPLFIEGKDKRIRELAESISEHVYELSSDDRKYLHLAAVFACNFTNHCYTLAAEVLEKKGLPFDVMLPLVDETARKVHELHPHDAQTGPAVRGDENVMNAQAALLDGRNKEIYELLSKSIQER